MNISMTSNVIYFELNDWEPNKYYPDEEPFKTWMETLPFPLIDDKWAKENKLCIVYELIDQSMNYCITANKEWVEKNCPRLLTHYQQFLRESEDNIVYGHWRTEFLKYIPENFGSRYYR